MATIRGLVAAGVVLGGIWGGMCVAASGQSSTSHQTYPPSAQTPGISDPMDDPRVPAANKATQEKMAISRNDERQKRLVADTNQLLDLAMKLKDEVDKTDKYTLSLDVVKRTAEIEKLAKSIRERMKD